jgi:hypothetical protein
VIFDVSKAIIEAAEASNSDALDCGVALNQGQQVFNARNDYMSTFDVSTEHVVKRL